MKRIVTLFLSLVLLLSCLCAPASAMFDPSLFYEVQAKSAYIVNTDTNIIVYDKDSSRQVSAGGLTKYMTIALLLTNYADQLDNTFQMPFAISDRKSRNSCNIQTAYLRYAIQRCCCCIKKLNCYNILSLFEENVHMKRIVTLFLSLILLLSCLCAPASALFDPSLFYEVQARSAYIVNTDTNIIVYDKDSSRQVPAGGLTKYMTIALLLTNYADQLDNTFQMPFAISDYVHNSDNADMRSNETFTYREAVYAMLLRNANEAAMGLAYSLSGGDLAGWVSQMNTLSQRIGTTGSTWTDACGLDSGNVTTAVDMYLILRYLMSFDAFVDISSAPAFTMPAKEKHTKSFVLLNQNVALNKTSGGSFYRKSMQGGMCDVMAYKNDHGDQSYVSWANQDGSTYIFCLMQSPDTCDTYGYANRRPALYETTRLIDWVFQSFSIQPALDTDLALAEIPVKYSSDTDTLKLYPDNSMMTLLPSSGDGTVTQKYFHLPDYVCAPVQQGDVVGTVELKLAGETIGMVNLIAGQDVSRSSLLYSFSKLQEFFGSLYLKVVLVVSAICAIIYVAWVLLNSPHTRHSSKKVHRYGRPRD